MDLLEQFQQFIKSKNLFDKKDRLLIAVSAGVDSVVLTELCKRAGYNFAIAHCNFQLRGSESEGDEKFVKELAASIGVPFFSKSFDTTKYAEEHKLGIQVAARNLRYQWFYELLEDKPVPFNYILTAHHQNDNIETLLMNFLKGTGIAGLQGIALKGGKNNKVIRPLLFATKDSLTEFAIANNISFREDSSNQSDDYTRNYFRNNIIPAIKKIIPQVEENLSDNITRFSEINIIYQEWKKSIAEKLIVRKKSEIHIPVNKLKKISPLITCIYEITREFNFTASQASDIVKLMSSSSGKYIDSSTHRILKNRDWFIIAPREATTNQIYLIEAPDSETFFEDYNLVIRKKVAHDKIDGRQSIAELDASGIKFPLMLRKWKQGDYFYPLGMKKKKKLSRFFIDKKLSLTEKQNVWVVESEKKIIWIVGQRIDERFKITPLTKSVLQLQVLPAQ